MCFSESGFPNNQFKEVFISTVIKHREENSYHKYWSYSLKTPITKEQRVKQIQDTLKKHSNELDKL